MVIKSKKLKKLQNYTDLYPDTKQHNFRQFKLHISKNIRNISKKDINLLAGLLVHIKNKKSTDSK